MANLTAKEIIKKIEFHKSELKQFGVKKLGLFGSYAKGTAKKDSDLDFLVEFKDGRGLFDDYMGLMHLLKGMFKKDVDLVKTKLVKEALKESILEGKRYEAEI